MRAYTRKEKRIYVLVRNRVGTASLPLTIYAQDRGSATEIGVRESGRWRRWVFQR